MRLSNNDVLNTGLVYYTYWTNLYSYNIYERLDLLTIYLIDCEKAYCLATPLIKDCVFDRLLRELQEIENKLNFSYECSPVKNVGKR